MTNKTDQTTDFDDIEEGQIFSFGEYLLPQQEVIEFATRWDPQPFHIDETAAKQSHFGGLTASSLHIFAVCTRLFSDYRPAMNILAMLGKDELRIPAPARPLDTLTYRSECISKKASASKPERGIIVLQDQVTNQHNDIILTQKVTLMLARRGQQ
ncbi:MAG: hypothetical protein KUG79_19485 [Pseudomonadales bacterium]|nr:hypothetical protein [Pseudomonadales bacterium]